MSPYQVVLRWIVQQNATFVVGTGDPAHMASDSRLFDFEVRRAALSRDEAWARHALARPSSQLSTQEMDDVSALGSAAVWGFGGLHGQRVVRNATPRIATAVSILGVVSAAFAMLRNRRCERRALML